MPENHLCLLEISVNMAANVTPKIEPRDDEEEEEAEQAQLDLEQASEDPDEDLTSCRICLHGFDEVERIPKYMLGCHHYFCLKCLQVVQTTF